MNFKELINDTREKVENRFQQYYKNEEKSPFLKEALNELLRMKHSQDFICTYTIPQMSLRVSSSELFLHSSATLL